mmetsp:Transcript_5606/g.8613  ORF Transcript_5606/g.8613 Transcript_5606/m.8613 type:complete len:417 (+) Transcript_5606:129-1379(+)|eukprot:CAMPEP_0195298124 /NCGR_PEP_ID=MMETSP0707-20130614/22842_1 /TAXON_ID=33640 /ORGANISM="Asterionellopsis glacialis, Strain CCMP134" /LENGTH=416 /DNA_ID=CAMNT_0040360123 /DNA_START=88 /DNA_END=1338 /DNA_ORIENTATION=+
MEQPDDLLGDDTQPFKIDKFDWMSGEFNSQDDNDDSQAPFEPMPIYDSIVAPKIKKDEDSAFASRKKESQRKKRYYETTPEKDRPTPCRRRRKKPNGMPKRPLSAYNIFFQKERVKLMESGETTSASGKIGFEELGRIIGQRWRTLDASTLDTYKGLADEDSDRYREEMEAYNKAKDLAEASPKIRRPRHRDGTPSRSNQETCKQYTETRPQRAAQHAMPQHAMPQHAIQPMGYASQYQEYPPVHYGCHPPPHNANYGQPQCQDLSCPGCVAKQQHLHQSIPQHEQGHTFSHATPATPSAPQSQHFPQMRSHGSTGMPEQPNLTNGSSYFPVDHAGQMPHHPAYPPNTFPLPAGQEIALPDSSGNLRKYRVAYAAVSMTVEEAEKYMEQNTNNNLSSPHASRANFSKKNEFGAPKA